MDLIKRSISTVDLQSSSFNIFFNKKEIPIFFNSNIIGWLKNYKPDFFSTSLEEFSFNFPSLKINPEIYALIKYIYFFTLTDIHHVFKFSLLPKNEESVLELGSGAGFFIVLLYKLLEEENNFNIDVVEINESDEEDESCFYKFRNNNVNRNILYKKVGQKEDEERKKLIKVSTLSILKEFISINNIKCNIFNPETLRKQKIKNKYNFVYSFRSYCFLYDFNEYKDFLMGSMCDNSIIICDVAEDKSQHIKFNKFFDILKKLDAKQSFFYRTIGKIKK